MAGAAGRRLMAVFAVAIAVLLNVATRVVEHTPALSVRRCVSPDAPLAWLGVHLRVLREGPGCGAGQLAWHPGSGHTTELVLMVTVPALLANLGLVLGAVGVWAALRAVPSRAAAVFGRLCRRLPGVGPVLPTLRPLGTGRWPAMRVPRAWQLDRSPVCRRGPPMSEATR
ncbi:hypothetical protein Adu01nite_43860 [Paractinoplanes durhamensis]|uniref:Uncharacterized protein n=2 Tax=Paractinoplanes durhamensis TaxID=113563 RepID=A0ABQ3YZP7_9ACTN|nr:hypothetical protein Adu01nite_43860 [Actinoplanes durhamensis]